MNSLALRHVKTINNMYHQELARIIVVTAGKSTFSSCFKHNSKFSFTRCDSVTHAWSTIMYCPFLNTHYMGLVLVHNHLGNILRTKVGFIDLCGWA